MRLAFAHLGAVEALGVILDYEHIKYTEGVGPGVRTFDIAPKDEQRCKSTLLGWASALQEIYMEVEKAALQEICTEKGGPSPPPFFLP